MDHPILEPLSEATKTCLSAIYLARNIYLVVSLDEKMDHFILSAVSATPSRPSLSVSSFLPKEAVATSDVKTATGEAVIITSRNPIYGELNKFLARIPESFPVKKNVYDRYRAALTDYTALMIQSAIPKEKIIFGSDDAQQWYEFLLRRFHAQTSRALLQSRFKNQGIVPEAPEDFDDHPEFPLSDYQRVAMQMGVGQEALALFMDRGTGKTATSISRMCLEAKRHRAGRLGDKPRMMRTLIVCPNQVRLNWFREIEKFATIAGKVTILRGGQFERLKLLTYAVRSEDDCAFSAVIVGYDTLSVEVDSLTKIPWDLVICDESHYFKNTKTERFKALRQIRDVSSRRMILTGTPIANSGMDLWAQLEFLAEGASGFKVFENYRRFFGKYEHGVVDAAGNGVSKLVGMKNIPLLQERLCRLSFAVTKEEAHLGLPPKVYDLVEVEMTAKQTELYNRMASALKVEIKNMLDGSVNNSMTAENILTSLLRLSQICSGFVRWDKKVDLENAELLSEAKTEQIPGENPKIEALVEMLKAEDKDPNEKTIIWCCFIEDIRAISERLTKEGIVHGCYYGGVRESDRQTIVDRFNSDPTFKVFIANPATAGEGLNLLGFTGDQETYCGHEIFFSQNWSAIQRAQAEDRAHRRGTKSTVRITDLVVPNTIDQEIRDRVQKKQSNASLIQDVSAILKNILDMKV